MLQAGRSPVQVPNEVHFFFNLFNPSSRTIALGSTQPLTKMSTRNLGVKSGRRVGLTTLPPSVCRMSENVGASTSRNPKGLHGLYRDNFILPCTQSVGVLGQGISPSQGRYLHTEQHKHRINAHNTDIHALSGIRTHDPSFQASEDSSCLTSLGHCDRLFLAIRTPKIMVT
jgi:hypothetical protein